MEVRHGARELGWFGSYRYPRYGGAGGLPLNLELLLRDLEHRYGAGISPWEMPLALFRARGSWTRSRTTGSAAPARRPR